MFLFVYFLFSFFFRKEPIKHNLLTAAKSLRSGNLLTFADAMTKTVVLSGKHAGTQSKQLTMKMLKEVTVAARNAVYKSTNNLAAMGDNVSTRLLGLEPTVVQALVQLPDPETVPRVGDDVLSWATRKRELGIITLEEYVRVTLMTHPLTLMTHPLSFFWRGITTPRTLVGCTDPP